MAALQLLATGLEVLAAGLEVLVAAWQVTKDGDGRLGGGEGWFRPEEPRVEGYEAAAVFWRNDGRRISRGNTTSRGKKQDRGPNF
jgi:hypothetical protein